jgi:predicted SAM-dependent methyltransferase
MTADGNLKINIGSGLSGVDGWYNIDNSPTILLSRLPLGRKLFKTPVWPRDVHRHDVKKGLPFPDGSASYIYSSHAFEHFTYDESLTVAKECFRVLRTNGVLRIVVPDLRLIVGDYLRDQSPLASHNFLQRLSLAHNLRDLIHPGANHAQMFDERSLTHLLQQAGFAHPELSSFMSSRIPDIKRIELEQRKGESLYVEAEKQAA